MNMSFFRRTALLVVLVAGAALRQASFAQPSDSSAAIRLELSDLLEEIRQNNPGLRASRLEAEMLGQRGAQARALPDPVASVMVSGRLGTQWRVEQPIPYPGTLDLAGRIADLSAEVASYETRAYEQDLLLEAKLAYYELYRIQRQASLVKAFQEQLKDFEEAASVQYAVGTGMQQAILKAQLEKNTLSGIAYDLSEQHRTTAEMLARVLNRPDAASFAAAVTVETPHIPEFDEAALLALALDRRPEVDALDAAQERAGAEVELARKAFKPDFGVMLEYSEPGFGGMPADRLDGLMAGVMVKIPLQRSRLKARLEEARLQQAQVAARREEIETSLRTQIGDLVTRLREQKRRLDLFQNTLVPQAETTLASTLSAYTTGRTDFLDLLDAQRMLFDLSTGYEDELVRYLTTIARLERVLGVESIDDLATLTALK